ncbi:MAG: class I SAM-dependent methyltransferase [Flavobacteriales bacterium]|nr:class I SAM-dependent methyltransferase [Flavobacteriales bacterium]
MDEIKPIAMPGTHEKFMEFFKRQDESTDQRILDLGAGHGAFTKKLNDMGYNMFACDLFPEIFQYDKIECKKVDITQHFPYDDNAFDMVIAVEVSEHILDHENFFAEISRILKPEGKLYLSTPNILSLKSRMRFLFRGFFYSFNPLEITNYDGLQHVASRTLDQYNYIAVKHGFREAEFDIDRKQSTSRWLLVLLTPAMFVYKLIKRPDPIHNHRKLLLGRLLFLTYFNNKTTKV